MADWSVPQQELPDPTDKVALASNFAALFEVPEPDESLYDCNAGMPRIEAGRLEAYALGGNPTSEVADWTKRYHSAHEHFLHAMSGLVQQVIEREEMPDAQVCNIVTAAAYFNPHPLSQARILGIIERCVEAKQFAWAETVLRLGGFLSLENKRELAKDLPTLQHGSWQLMLEKLGKVSNAIQKPGDKLQDEPASAYVKDVMDKAIENNSTETYDTMFGPKIYFRGTDGELAMLRYVDVEEFAAWKKAYEAEAVWRERGFKHIPIEPILDYRTNPRTGGTHIRTVFLNGVDYASAERSLHGKAKHRLQQQRFEIKRGLDSLGINHGHMHPDNILAVEVDGEYRLYLIDFDKAIMRTAASFAEA